MDMYLYRLFDFAFEDEEDEEQPNDHKYAHLVETKLTTVVPMAYGYYNIGLNYIEIYPYHRVTLPARPILIFAGKEQESPEAYSMLIPYQNKALVQDVFSKWLDVNGYPIAAQAVKENHVTHLKRSSYGIPKESISYIKRLDRIKTVERNNQIYINWQKNSDAS